MAGPFLEHLDHVAKDWIGLTVAGRSVAITAATNVHVDAINDAVQRLRLTIGDLPQDHAVRIAGVEVAHPGDVVATRRNDRDLRTTTGEPVRNRDLWEVVSTHRDGSLTVAHRAGHGVGTLPADYVREHVGLGYAATEHGNQADTVDAAIELVSTATTHRGLYVGATRGRDENRIHVVTETADRAEARVVLETVLAHDRADIPAVTQRRELARQAPPAQPRRFEPASIVPDWVGPWRAQVEQRREDLLGYLEDRAVRRGQAAAELADLQPQLIAARTAWQPYGSAIAEIEDDLHAQLRPAMWKANHDAMRAGLGRHHASRRRARAANVRVADAEARGAAIHVGAADVEQRLDALEAEASNLHDLAYPSPGGFGLEALNREQVHEIDRLLGAVGVWTAWADGRRVAVTDLVESAELLTDAARQAPLIAVSTDEIDRSQWIELLEPLLGLLSQRGVDLVPEALNLERAGPDLGVGL